VHTIFLGQGPLVGEVDAGNPPALFDLDDLYAQSWIGIPIRIGQLNKFADYLYPGATDD
jgi:hypothetical protein